MKNRLIRVVVFLFFLPGVAVAREDKVKIFVVATGEVVEVDKVSKSPKEWKKILTPEQYRVMREKGTESPFRETCPLSPKGQSGIYQCAGCATDLFRYNAKFDSGTGWPSFWEPVSELNIRLIPDDSLGMRRTEILCARCDAHLGHVFDDGPAPSGKRYCINALSLKLALLPASFKSGTALAQAAFAAGCFWGVEAAFQEVEGVVATTVGYMGGKTKDPSYEQVSSGKTGHAETVRVEYAPKKVTYEYLLSVFWGIHDPTTLNRQGPDIGAQYRSIIFYYTPEQEKAALDSKKKLQSEKRFKNPVVTEILPAAEFYKAEDYHQQYFRKQGIKPTCHLPTK
jgi:peptide methionine sulfoxide reductase msrA/msrB